MESDEAVFEGRAVLALALFAVGVERGPDDEVGDEHGEIGVLSHKELLYAAYELQVSAGGG